MIEREFYLRQTARLLQVPMTVVRRVANRIGALSSPRMLAEMPRINAEIISSLSLNELYYELKDKYAESGNSLAVVIALAERMKTKAAGFEMPEYTPEPQKLFTCSLKEIQNGK